jgi:hypothetical protein
MLVLLTASVSDPSAHNVELENEIRLLTDAVTNMNIHISRGSEMSEDDMYGMLLTLNAMNLISPNMCSPSSTTTRATSSSICSS